MKIFKKAIKNRQVPQESCFISYQHIHNTGGSSSLIVVGRLATGDEEELHRLWN